jgi:hypothetical protein
MRTIAVTSSCGKENGHVAGNHCLDVEVTIMRTCAGRWKVSIVETWGSCQGHDEEHGRKTVKAIGPTLPGAAMEARNRSEVAGLHASNTIQALLCAEEEASDAEETADKEASATKATS